MYAIHNWLHRQQISHTRGLLLAPFTTYRVGGAAEVAVFPKTVGELVTLVALCRRRGVPCFLLGGGANVIISDDGLPGVTILTRDMRGLAYRGGRIEAECGVTNETLAEFAAARGLRGFEFIFDVPGSVGGSLVMNAGNNHGEMADVTCAVQVLGRNGRVRWLRASGAAFGYRTSRFKQTGAIVLQAVFRAAGPDDPARIRERMMSIRAERRQKFPLEYPNGGSVFKRPPGDYAGRLIEVSGCGGLRVGDAQVSTKHRGFIVNLGRATAMDIRSLIAKVQQRVRAHSGVMLEREQIFLPEDRIPDTEGEA